jgi:hypothetical protein
MTPIHIPKGARIYFGAPAQPMPYAVSDALKTLTSTVPGIAEAHLPQCCVEGAEAPKQILVVVPLRPSDTQAVLDSLGSHLPEILPNGFYIDIWPVPASDPKLEAIRAACCAIFISPERPLEAKKPWWKFWGHNG